MVALLLLLVPALAASGLLAYTLGLRHGFDADHIAAIDNVTRRLTGPGTPPLTVGLFFAMGHSTVVTLMCIAVVVASSYMEEHLDAAGSVGGIIGTSISGSFLVLIGFANGWATIKLARAWRLGSSHAGHSHQVPGCCVNCCPTLVEGIRHPWQMMPLGFLFGLGFDTSSEIALLGIVSISRDNVPRGYIMLLPLLFMGGMCLVDTLDGIFMAWAYGRAVNGDEEQHKKLLYYNMFVTAISGLIAIFIGVVELLGVIADSLSLDGGIWDAVAAVNDNFELLGCGTVALFLLAMLLALACSRRVFPRRQPAEEKPAAAALVAVPTAEEQSPAPSAAGGPGAVTPCEAAPQQL